MGSTNVAPLLITVLRLPAGCFCRCIMVTPRLLCQPMSMPIIACAAASVYLAHFVTQ
jgi:hypothetical protein